MKNFTNVYLMVLQYPSSGNSINEKFLRLVDTVLSLQAFSSLIPAVLVPESLFFLHFWYLLIIYTP